MALLCSVLLKVVRAYVRLMRHESLTLHQITQGIRTSGMPWLSAATAVGSKTPNQPQSQQRQQGQQQQQQQQQRWLQGQGQESASPRPAVCKARHVCDMRALQFWVWWLMAELVTPLIRAAFYVTETEPFKHQVFYFRCVSCHGEGNSERSKGSAAGGQKLMQVLMLHPRLRHAKETGIVNKG